jgi:hypothetical protein
MATRERAIVEHSCSQAGATGGTGRKRAFQKYGSEARLSNRSQPLATTRRILADPAGCGSDALPWSQSAYAVRP